MKKSSLTRTVSALALVTVIFGTLYATVQQTYRQAANDPQIQVAEDTAAKMDLGGKPQQPDISTLIPMQTSLAQFVIIYNATNTPIFSTGQLAGKIPSLPESSFVYTKANNENIFTWQPAPDVRIAAVAHSYKDGVVVVGRSLREVQKRINSLGLMVSIGWILSILATILLLNRKGKEHHLEA